MEINTPADIALVDAAIKLEQGGEARAVLAELLDVTNPGWREKPAFIERIKEVGADVALVRMLKPVRDAVDATA